MKRYLKCVREYCTDFECQNSAPIISDIAALLDFSILFHLQTILGWCYRQNMGRWGCNKYFQQIVIIYGQRWVIVTIVLQN